MTHRVDRIVRKVVLLVAGFLLGLPAWAQPFGPSGDLYSTQTSQSIHKGSFFIKGGTLGIRPAAATNGNVYGIFKLPTALGQVTTYTIPDPGGASANFLLSTGSQTITGQQTFTVAPIAPAYVMTGTSFNGTIDVVSGLGQATTYNLPDAGASSDTIATLKAANIFTGSNTFPTSGIILKGTSFNGTLQEIAGLGQASTYTLPDPGAASTNILTDAGVTSAITIQHIAVPLTSANLLGMYATPVQLIAAGAAGTNIIVHHAELTMVRTATAYASGGTVVIQSGSTANGAGTQVTGTIASSVLTTAGAATTYTVVIPVAFTSAAATGIYISNQTGAFTTGTGTATVDLWYSIK